MIILVRALNHNGESSIEFSMRFTKVFIQPELGFTYDREDFLVKMRILLKPNAFHSISKIINSGKQMKY